MFYPILYLDHGIMAIWRCVSRLSQEQHIIHHHHHHPPWPWHTHLCPFKILPFFSPKLFHFAYLSYSPFIGRSFFITPCLSPLHSIRHTSRRCTQHFSLEELASCLYSLYIGVPILQVKQSPIQSAVSQDPSQHSHFQLRSRIQNSSLTP